VPKQAISQVPPTFGFRSHSKIFFFEAKKPSVKMGRFNAGRQGRGKGGRGNGHTSSGGRGEGKSCSNNNKSSSIKKTENINDFVFQPLQLGKQQASNTYESVKEFVVKHIQRTFLNGQDIAKMFKARSHGGDSNSSERSFQVDSSRRTTL
jgi:hypothetical protein